MTWLEGSVMQDTSAMAKQQKELNAYGPLPLAINRRPVSLTKEQVCSSKNKENNHQDKRLLLL